MKHALVRKNNYPPAVFRENQITEEISIIAWGTLLEMLELLNRWHEECTIEEPTDKDYKIIIILEKKAEEFKKALQDGI
tara:strand:- start:198 stop:434 length:237 start_codon:yes stop_codon:yes gene_type:complete